jgi:hypothetical protein
MWTEDGAAVIRLMTCHRESSGSVVVMFRGVGRPARSELRRMGDECLVARSFHSAFVNGRRQQGHSPSIPRVRLMNAVGWGIVMIALKASGSRCA